MWDLIKEKNKCKFIVTKKQKNIENKQNVFIKTSIDLHKYLE